MSDTENDRADADPGTRLIASRIVVLLAWGAAITLALYFLPAVQVVLLGVIAACCLTAALRPLQHHVPGPCWLAGIVVGTLPVIVLAGVIWLLYLLLADPLGQEIERLPERREQINQTLASWSQRVGLVEPVTIETLTGQAGKFLTDGQAFSLTASVLSGLAIAAVFVFFGTLFMLVEPPGRLLPPVLRLLPERRRPQLKRALEELEPKFRWWTIGTLFNMVVTGVTSWAGYALVLGTQQAAPLAILAALGEMVPNIGPMFAFVIALVFAAPQGPGAIAGVTAVYVVLQTVESYILIPMVMRKAVNEPAVVTLFSVVFWGKVLGVGGLLLAIPLNMVVWSLVTNLVNQTRSEDAAATRDTTASRDEAPS